MPSKTFYLFQVLTEGVIAFLIVTFFEPQILSGQFPDWEIVAEGIQSPLAPAVQSAMIVVLIILFGLLIFASVFPTVYKEIVETRRHPP